MGLPSAQHWVGFFGGLRTEKGLLDVLHAVARANDELGSTHLLVCGRGGNERAERSIRALAKQVHVDDRIHYLGEIDGVEDAMTAADVVVVATRRGLSEALPATMAEAMACGTPVVAYATGGIPEIIGADGDAGRLVAPDDPEDLGRVLIEVLRDTPEARRIATAALARARELFDPARAADRYEQLFAALS